MSASSASRRPAPQESKPDQPGLHVLETDARAVRRRQGVDDLVIAVAVVLLSVFMLGLFRYVLSPAVRTVTNATTGSSAPGGP